MISEPTFHERMGVMKHKILQLDPSLTPFESDLDLRMENYRQKKQELLAPGQTLADFASGYL